jgi:transposase
MGRPSKHSLEVRERAVRMVFDQTPEHRSQWATIRSVGEKLGVRTESLRRWVRLAERDTGQRPGLTTSERDGLPFVEHQSHGLGFELLIESPVGAPDLFRGFCHRCGHRSHL